MIPIPSRRFLALLAGASALFLVHPLVALFADGLLLVAVALDAFAVLGPDALRVTRRTPARISLGATAVIDLLIDNRGRRRVTAQVTDDLPALLEREGDDVYPVVLEGNRETRVRYEVRTVRRGDAHFGDVHLRIAGPLELAWVQRRVQLAQPVRVVPGVLEVKRFRLLGLRNRLREAGFRNVRQRGEGGQFESLREYVRGDDPRHLDWRRRRGAAR